MVIMPKISEKEREGIKLIKELSPQSLTDEQALEILKEIQDQGVAITIATIIETMALLWGFDLI